MIPKIKKILKNPLFSGSAIMIIGANATFSLGYLYHIFMGKLMTPQMYGELISLFSLINLLGMIPMSLGLVITKLVSSAKNTHEGWRVIVWMQKKVIVVSLTLFVIVCLLSPMLQQYLNISSLWVFVLVGATFLFSIPGFFNRSALQGLLKFKIIVLSLLGENVAKLVLGVAAVVVGFGTSGAIGALVMAACVGWLVTLPLYSSKPAKVIELVPEYKSLIKYSFPVILFTMATTSIYSSDVLLVKHYLTSHDAGLYGAMTTLGRILVFGTSPIAGVMFPIIAQKHSKQQPYLKIFYYSLLLTVGLLLTALLFFSVIPHFILQFSYNPLYVEAAPMLLWFGLAISLFAISSLFVNFFLALGKTSIVTLVVASAIAQILGLILFHANIWQVVHVSLTVNALLLLGCLVYFAHATKIGFSNSTRLQTREDHR